MRLGIVKEGKWIGGVVLGSTFPNMKPRDEAFGLSDFLVGCGQRGLRSPWARENRDYWERLQLIVNHARTYIFPAFRGAGLGIAAHSLLLTEGRRIWEDRYGAPVYGFDTLDRHPTSRLFTENGWQLVGRTKGYARDPSRVFSRRAHEEEWADISDNAGLTRHDGNTRWWIWVRVFRRFGETATPVTG